MRIRFRPSGYGVKQGVIRQRDRRKFVVEKLGGKCSICGSTDSLEIDHIVPIGKDRGTALSHLSESNILYKLSDYQLLCTKHHIEKSNNERKSRPCKHGHPPNRDKHGNCKTCVRYHA